MNTVSRTVLREQIKEILLERILRGELEPGERLVETRLARELGTSQAPVREALRDLQLLRLVESEPFRGARVRAVDDSQLLPVFPVRAVLEELAAREAARKAKGEVGVLDRELEAMRDAAARGDWRTQISHDIAFHRAMVELAGNEPLLQSWLGLGIEVSTAFAVYWTFWDQSDLAEFHVPIVEAIRAGDKARAGSEARKHVRRTERVVRRRTRAAERQMPGRVEVPL
ncbi:MAG: GntR family transcriptional regulator [Actinobacteria bacterium]|nr:GntR family transcriptional regulator [Actinomycetota bacterium]MDQ3424638.1 GntR family transcriptional regulator [Actinomycetota bacterium]